MSFFIIRRHRMVKRQLLNACIIALLVLIANFGLQTCSAKQKNDAVLLAGKHAKAHAEASLKDLPKDASVKAQIKASKVHAASQKAKNDITKTAHDAAAATRNTDDRNLFRSQKMNEVWSKARQRLLPHELDAFKKEALQIDKTLMTKKAKTEAGKVSNSVADAADHGSASISKLLDNYQLLPHFPEYQPSTYTDVVDAKTKLHHGAAADVAATAAASASGGPVAFADKKLSKLWAKAQTAGFSPEELRMLEQEFRQHQQKLNDAPALSTAQEELRRSDAVPPHNAAGTPLTKKELKKHKDKHVAAVGQYASDELEATHFDVKTVEKLWQAAQQSNFSPQELEMVRQELEQFEARVSKLRTLRTEPLAGVADKEEEEYVSSSNNKRPLMDELGLKLRHLTQSIETLYESISAKVFSTVAGGADTAAGKKASKKAKEAKTKVSKAEL